MMHAKTGLGRLIFWSRWLQLPMYLGLIVALGIYSYKFLIKLTELTLSLDTLQEDDILLSVLSLIDVVMIANLLVMVIVGGYEIFVSRLDIHGHPDQPEWLSHVDAGVLKVKLGMALITISSIHLLRSFIDAGNIPEHTLKWEVIIHMVLVFSAGFIAATDWLIQVKARQLGHSQPSGTTSSH
ncbi:TIGR00645 family protein [Perlucidibaca piscinae]|uniref:TIGR00645 family protein n=1 Tax=Perlucidibaca piscinae TaxID=392589 RepID=UPI0003B5DF15|nr:TIGR00645 family protein [Perlucidibaca piscinae]